ncbi:hypothetical protein OSB04_012758 [Centaurea solstitialis]|uniref:FAS1 domain-containing protein n=1 Tax=Centaurea solstitialis TaxID=347529 RepID=A0AA38TDP8_9ASTR|nr:hypothetical protein OSB04_012758 [Centaurea solstitialis]
MPTSLLLFILLSTVALTTTTTHLRRLSAVDHLIPIPPLSTLPPQSPPEYIQQQQLKNIIDALIGAGDYTDWADILLNANSSTIPTTATMFVPRNKALTHLTATAIGFDPFIIPYHILPQRLTFSDLQLIKTLTRLPTLLPSKTVVITNNTPANFTIDGALIVQPDIYLSPAVCVHGIGAVLDYTVYGNADSMAPASGSLPPMPTPSLPLPMTGDESESSPELRDVRNSCGTICVLEYIVSPNVGSLVGEEMNDFRGAKSSFPPTYPLFAYVMPTSLLLFFLLSTVALTTTTTHLRRLSAVDHQIPIPPLSTSPPQSPPEYIQQQQLKNIIDALIGTGDYTDWADILFNANTNSSTIAATATATMFVPGNEALNRLSATAIGFDSFIIPYHILPQRLTFSDLQLIKTLTRLPTLLPSKTVVITNNTPANFTIDDALIVQPDIYQSPAVCVHGIGAVLDYTVYGDADSMAPASGSFPPMSTPSLGDESESSPELRHVRNSCGAICVVEHIELMMLLLVTFVSIARLLLTLYILVRLLMIEIR